MIRSQSLPGAMISFYRKETESYFERLNDLSSLLSPVHLWWKLPLLLPRERTHQLSPLSVSALPFQSSFPSDYKLVTSLLQSQEMPYTGLSFLLFFQICFLHGFPRTSVYRFPTFILVMLVMLPLDIFHPEWPHALPSLELFSPIQ